MQVKNHRTQCKTNGVNICILINNMRKIIIKYVTMDMVM